MDLLVQLNKYTLRGKYTCRGKEWAFQKELFSHLKKDGFICYHIEDTSYWYRFLDGICVTPEGFMFALELKIIDKYTFNISQFEDSQIALMDEMIKRGCTPYVGIFSIWNNEYRVLTYQEIIEQQNDKWGIKLFNKIK